MKTSPNKAHRLPVFELRPNASHEEVVARVNALHSEARAWENLHLEGGQVHRANGNVVLALGAGSGASGGSGGSGAIATPSPANPPDTPNPDGTPAEPSPITGGGTTINTGTGGNNFTDTFTEITVVSATEVGDVPAGVPAASVSMEYRIKGGVATLVGFDEFASPSNPPKKYRTKTLSGNVTTGLFSDAAATIGLGLQGPNVTLTGAGSGCWQTLVFTNGVVTGDTSYQNWPIYFGVIYYANGSVSAAGTGSAISRWPLQVGDTVQGTGFGARNPFSEGSYRYEFITWSNGGIIDIVNMGTIVIGTGGETLTYSGQITYDAATGLSSSTGAVAGTQYSTSTHAIANVATPVSSINEASSRLGLTLNATDTATTHALAAPTQVVLVEAGVYRKPTACALTDTLSAEDLDTDAIDRLYAVIGPDAWSDSDPTSAITGAQWSDRGSGYTFTFFEAELTITVGSTALLTLTTGDAYVLNVELWPFETHSLDVVISAGGDATAVISILPLEAGTTAIYVKAVSMSY